MVLEPISQASRAKRWDPPGWDDGQSAAHLPPLGGTFTLAHLGTVGGCSHCRVTGLLADYFSSCKALIGSQISCHHGQNAAAAALPGLSGKTVKVTTAPGGILTRILNVKGGGSNG